MRLWPPRLSEGHRSLTAFLNSAEKAAVEIRRSAERKNRIHIISHFDSDGIASGSIMATALWRLRVEAKVSTVQGLTDSIVSDLADDYYDGFIFTDIGSGYTQLLRLHEKFPGQILVLDHHPARPELDPSMQVNPRIHGFDGGVECCGSTVAYLIARSLSPHNRDLSHLAVVGSLADQQDKGEGRTLKTLNLIPLQDAQSLGIVTVTEDLLFYGRETRPLHRALALTTNPFLPGLTGREDACISLLSRAGIPLKREDRWVTAASLLGEERTRLLSAIGDEIHGSGKADETVTNLVGAVYTLSRENPLTSLRDAREFATLLNACGRMGRPGLGNALCMGDRGSAVRQSEELLQDYRRSLSFYIAKITEDQSTIERKGVLTVVRGDDFMKDSMTGAVSSMLSGSRLIGESVTLVVARKNGAWARLSARGTEGLVGKGLDLGALLSQVCGRLGGIGGGHSIAAGAEIQWEKLKEFVSELEVGIRRQVSV